MDFHLTEEDIRQFENKLYELAKIEEKNGYGDGNPMDDFEAVIARLEEEINEFEGE